MHFADCMGVANRRVDVSDFIFDRLKDVTWSVFLVTNREPINAVLDVVRVAAVVLVLGIGLIEIHL